MTELCIICKKEGISTFYESKGFIRIFFRVDECRKMNNLATEKLELFDMEKDQAETVDLAQKILG